MGKSKGGDEKMLIATLPTMVGEESIKLSEEIISSPLIDAVRYNSGGSSPYAPKQILEILKPIADRYKKILYIDLEGRQMRIACWTPHSRGMVVLNRDFEIELPAMIHFRRVGWFDIVNVLPEERKIFFQPRNTRQEYYFGESQSVNIVAKNFEVIGDYCANLDTDYIKAAVELGIRHFMLSFVENLSDLRNFYEICINSFRKFHGFNSSDASLFPIIVLKIESQKGLEFIRVMSDLLMKKSQLRLTFMAARDDLFLSFVNNRADFLEALKLIVKKDKNAILASRIMSGLEFGNEVSLGDMADLTLMKQFGYKNFMFSDELSSRFEETMQNWQEIIVPLLAKNKMKIPAGEKNENAK